MCPHPLFYMLNGYHPTTQALGSPFPFGRPNFKHPSGRCQASPAPFECHARGDELLEVSVGSPPSTKQQGRHFGWCMVNHRGIYHRVSTEEVSTIVHGLCFERVSTGINHRLSLIKFNPSAKGAFQNLGTLHQPTNLPTYHPTNLSTTQPTYLPPNLPTYLPTNQPTQRALSQWLADAIDEFLVEARLHDLQQPSKSDNAEGGWWSSCQRLIFEGFLVVL